MLGCLVERRASPPAGSGISRTFGFRVIRPPGAISLWLICIRARLQGCRFCVIKDCGFSHCFRRSRKGRDHSQVHNSRVIAASDKPAPGFERIARLKQTQCPSKVVPTSGGHNQYGQAQPHQRPKMPVHRTVAAEDENRVESLPLGGLADHPLDLRVRLERFQIASRRPQPEDGSSAHFRRKSVAEKLRDNDRRFTMARAKELENSHSLVGHSRVDRVLRRHISDRPTR